MAFNDSMPDLSWLADVPMLPRGSRPARIESRIEVSICRCSGILASRSSTTRTPELVLLLRIELDLIVRTDTRHACPQAPT